MLATDDHSVLESGCIVLTSFMRVAAAHIATAEVNGTSLLQVLCQVLSKLLSPELDDTAAFSVGGLVTQVIRIMLHCFAYMTTL